MRAIWLSHGCEFHAQPTTGLHMAHNCFGPDLSFLYKKIQLSFDAQGAWTLGSNVQPPYAQVPYARNIIDTITTPIDPDAVRGLGARSMPTRIGGCLRRGRHKAP